MTYKKLRDRKFEAKRESGPERARKLVTEGVKLFKKKKRTRWCDRSSPAPILNGRSCVPPIPPIHFVNPRGIGLVSAAVPAFERGPGERSAPVCVRDAVPDVLCGEPKRGNHSAFETTNLEAIAGGGLVPSDGICS